MQLDITHGKDFFFFGKTYGKDLRVKKESHFDKSIQGLQSCVVYSSVRALSSCCV